MVGMAEGVLRMCEVHCSCMLSIGEGFTLLEGLIDGQFLDRSAAG